MGPKVSIVIPCYNREKFVGEAIESALNQTIREIEVIAIDNASTDRTWDIIQDFARRDSRVHAIRNASNIGPVLNWLEGIKKARAPLVKLVFSDDTIMPTYLERTLPMLQDDVGFVFCRARIGVDPEHSRSTYDWLPTTGVEDAKRFIHDSLFGGNVPVSPGVMLLRKQDALQSLIDHVPDGVTEDWMRHGGGPDLLFFLLTAIRYLRVGFVAEDLAFFRAHPGSFTLGAMKNDVFNGYQNARAWFARTHLSSSTQSRLAALLWLREIRRHNKPMAPPSGWWSHLFMAQTVVESARWLELRVRRNGSGEAKLGASLMYDRFKDEWR